MILGAKSCNITLRFGAKSCNFMKKAYKIIYVGSLLSVKLNRFESSFPVGKLIWNICIQCLLFCIMKQLNYIESVKIEKIYKNIPMQLAKENKKFKYNKTRNSIKRLVLVNLETEVNFAKKQR